METKKLIIVGAGPAGYTAAIYAARAQLDPLVFEGFYSGPPGGQLMTTTEVENFPGFPQGVGGAQLMQHFRDQAKRFDAQLVAEDVVSIDLSCYPLRVQSKRQELQSYALIIATGATAKRLDLPGAGDGEFWQKGVSACAICDGAMPIFRDQPLYVVGGGDSAAEEALFLTKYGSRVYVVHRRNQLRASKIMSERLLNHPKIEMIWESEIVAVQGDEVVREVTLRHLPTGQVSQRAAGGLFFAIGHTPNTAFLGGQLELDAAGYLKVQPGSTRTAVAGVFAAGDVADHIYRQAVTAAGSGCMAAIDAERWLSEQGYV